MANQSAVDLSQVKLSVSDHSRDSAGLHYVYPVISRRAGGLSIGINLNTNNACNWRCIYCQVPDLKRGKAPEVDLELLGNELHGFISDILHGDFYSRNAIPPELRKIRDIAISGNGEPTSASAFHRVVRIIGDVVEEFALSGKIKLVLITNGSLIYRSQVQKGLACLSELNGEVWFKLDSATRRGLSFINNTSLSIEKVRNNLETASGLCPTWIQTCVFAYQGMPPSGEEQGAYIEFIESVLEKGSNIKGVLLYGIARPSLQPEARFLSRLPTEWLKQFAAEINKKTGIEVKVNP